ncbi:hypothetical protein KC660_02795, partial [Candidatus Dojkabacteria bacterium]|nr:hypothetical protein [Candidatus Dojkabacteria bacterium]
MNKSNKVLLSVLVFLFVCGVSFVGMRGFNVKAREVGDDNLNRPVRVASEDDEDQETGAYLDDENDDSNDDELDDMNNVRNIKVQTQDRAVASLVKALSKKAENLQKLLTTLETKVSSNDDLTDERKQEMLQDIDDAQEKVQSYLDDLSSAETTDEVKALAKDFNDDYVDLVQKFRSNSERVRLSVANQAKLRLELLNQNLNDLNDVVSKYCPDELDSFQTATQTFQQEMEALNAALDTGDLNAIREQLKTVKSSLQVMKTNLIQSRNR